MKNEWNLADFEISSDIKNKSILPFLFIIVTIIGIILILYKFNIQVFEKYTLINEEDNLILIVDSKEILLIENQKELYIEGKKYFFEISEIDDHYTSLNNNIYQTVYIKILDYKTKAKTLEIEILRSNQTIFQRIIKFMKGEEV